MSAMSNKISYMRNTVFVDFIPMSDKMLGYGKVSIRIVINYCANVLLSIS
ncbi:hypothetical protein BO443_210092 [Burkholderia orbicola]